MPTPNHPPKTFELIIGFESVDKNSISNLKEQVAAWLIGHGIDGFVEGAIEVDINHDYEEERDFYEELGGDSAPISVYRYSQEVLQDLLAKLKIAFPVGIICEIRCIDTAGWMEGWKESFRPIRTDKFYVRPPWEAAMSAVPAGATTGRNDGNLIDLPIEPGMAFGTGQHATTKLCLARLEQLAGQLSALNPRLLDVGTGTGLLAIAAIKLGFSEVVGTDIEADAIMAADANAGRNGLESLLSKKKPSKSTPGLQFIKASGPVGTNYHVVVANILSVVLRRLMSELVAAVAPSGQLILSGILVEEEAEMIKQGLPLGLTLLGHSHLDGWTCLTFQKEGEAP